jgi:hypothetical protein
VTSTTIAIEVRDACTKRKLKVFINLAQSSNSGTDPLSEFTIHRSDTLAARRFHIIVGVGRCYVAGDGRNSPYDLGVEA